MAIFLTLKMAAATILDFRNYEFLTARRVMSVDKKSKCKE